MSIHEEMFGKFESVVEDPVIVSFNQKLQEYQQLIDDIVGISEDELRDIIISLDTEWPYTGYEVNVSGWATFMNPETEQPERRWFEDIEMQSRGFMIDTDEIVLDGESVAKTYRIVHALRYTDEERSVICDGIASVAEVTFNFPFDSIAVKRARLEYYYADTIDTVDSLVLNARNEEEAIGQLAPLRIEVSGAQREMLADLSAYIDSLLKYDRMRRIMLSLLIYSTSLMMVVN